MKTQPLSCCSPNKIHVLLALVPRHSRTLPTVFWYWLIPEAAMVGNKAIVPRCLGRIGLEHAHIASDQNLKWVKV